ncbi:A/G-specific adenine glycosylase [Desulfitobacterium dichloroeliminans]|nr:A/G-specific adenine glycosylase [Desulfitobacterium dichloroeliminans]
MKNEIDTHIRFNNWAPSLVGWYRRVKRDLPWRRSKCAYAIWVSEVMLQQTQVITVIPYYQRFMERFPDVFALAGASEEEVQELWRGLGYYSRARRLWEGARYVVRTTGGRMPEDFASLLMIPGVGEYTAGAIASIAYGECVPAIDGNVKRVLSRLLRWEEDVDKAKSYRFFLEYIKIVLPADCPGDFNQGLMELGATVCTPKNPKCELCPLQVDCQGYSLGNPTVYPVKKSREKVKEVLRPTLILVCEGRVLLKKRPSEGLLANLWEFPGEELILDSLADYSWYDLYKTQVIDRSYDEIVEELLQAKTNVQGPLVHTFSHRRWQMYWVVLNLDAGQSLDVHNSEQTIRESSSDYLGSEDRTCWLDVSQLERIALPVAFQKIWSTATGITESVSNSC